MVVRSVKCEEYILTIERAQVQFAPKVAAITKSSKKRTNKMLGQISDPWSPGEALALPACVGSLASLITVRRGSRPTAGIMPLHRQPKRQIDIVHVEE